MKNRRAVATQRVGFRGEFLLDGASPKSIWNQISSSRGLSEWFAPHVDLTGISVHVFWDNKGDDREATITDAEDGSYIQWNWEDDPESFIRMTIVATELSHTVSLLVEDHDLSMDTDTLEALWEKHIDRLKITLGIG